MNDKTSNRKSKGLDAPLVIARLIIVLFAIIWSASLAVILITQWWVIYWIFTGRNIMNDFKRTFDTLWEVLNVP